MEVSDGLDELEAIPKLSGQRVRRIARHRESAARLRAIRGKGRNNRRATWLERLAHMGALAGGEVGMETGAFLGSFFGPGPGTAIGGALGGLAGGAFGAIGGSQLGGAIFRWF